MVKTDVRPRRPRRLRRAAPRGAGGTRGALLTAATELFAARGFDGVSVAQIAQRAGVTKALVNYHFGGKRKLYETIMTSTFSEIAERLESLAASARPAPEQLQELVLFVGDMAATRRPHFPAMMLREVMTGGAHLASEVAPYLVRVLGAVRRIVEQGVRAGTLRPVDPLLTHLSLVGSLLFFFATAAFRERLAAATDPPFRPPRATDYVRHVQELVARGLAADPRPPGAPRPSGADA